MSENKYGNLLDKYMEKESNNSSVILNKYTSSKKEEGKSRYGNLLDNVDNNLIRVADKERVLTPAQNDIYEKFLNFAMDNYNSMMQNMIPSNLTPKNYDIVRKNDNVKMVTYQLNGDFVMPNVHDASKVSDLIKDLESIEIKAQQRVGRIN